MVFNGRASGRYYIYDGYHDLYADCIIALCGRFKFQEP